MEVVFYGNTVQGWIVAISVGFLVLLCLWAAEYVIVRRLQGLAGRTANQWDDMAAEILGKTRFTFLFFVGLYAMSRLLVLPERVSGAVEIVAFIALLVQLALWGNEAIAQLIRGYTHRRMEEDAATATTMRFVGFIGRVGLWVLIVLVALDNMDVDITGLVAGVGIGGIAVALAVQNVLGDLFASLSIVLDKPFVIGDFIIVGDLMGTVEHVGLKTTRVRSLSGEQLVFSNNDLLNSRIRNFKRMFERRIVFSFGVVYQTSHDQLARIPGMVRSIIEEQDDTRFDRAHFARYGDSALEFEVVYYVVKPDYNIYMDIQQAINLGLYRRFEEEGLEFAYPTRTLYVQQQVPAGESGIAAGR